jgi:acetyltransferase-like isoleucine patch superfamily enzyme
MNQYCIIEGNVLVGPRTVIKNFVEIRHNTVIGEDCYIDSGVKMSGECILGDRVTVRYDAIIAKGCDIGDDCYISPQVMFVNRAANGEAVGGAKVGQRVHIGTNATIMHGVTICDDVVIGAKALVTKDITVPGTYVGIPARLVQP